MEDGPLSHVIAAEQRVLLLFAPALLLPLARFLLRRRRTPPNQQTTFEPLPTRLEHLPPLPLPNYQRLCTEQILGAIFVALIVAFFMGIIEAVVSDPTAAVGPYGRWWFQLVAWTEAICACFSLLVLQLGIAPPDVQRSHERCFPLPEAVASRLRSENIDASRGLPDAWAHALHGLGNQKGSKGEYCVRCMLWRPPGSHHCSKCQVCAAEFDYAGTGAFAWAYGHHCVVTGCCVAGGGFRRNMWVFKVIMLAWFAGAATALVAALFWLAEGAAVELLILAGSMVLGVACVVAAVRWAGI